MLKHAALLMILPLPGGCTFLLDDRCGPVQRFTDTRGEFHDSEGAGLARTELSLVEERGGGASVVAVIMGGRGTLGAPLRGHVLRASLYDHAASVLVLELPVNPAPSGGDEVIGSATVAVSDVAAVKRTLLSGRGLLVLETDLPGVVVHAQLAEVHERDWSRASCS